MTLEQQILQTFSTQFVAYYRSHLAHWSVKGMNFYALHKLLKHIYKDLFKSTDTLAEITRSLDIELPISLAEIINLSEIAEIPFNDDNDSDETLMAILDDLQTLVKTFQQLEIVSSDLQHSQIENYSQERIQIIEKYIWMLKSTLTMKN